MGRKRLPPDEMRWLATSGIISTSEPALASISSLTRAMSVAVRSISCLMEGASRFPSPRLTTTPTAILRPICAPAPFPRQNSRRAPESRQEANWRGIARFTTGRGTERVGSMIELVRTNDPVIISFIEALMRDAGIAFMVADQNMSVMDGSIGILPRRILVEVERADEARRILTDAGIAKEMRPK